MLTKKLKKMGAWLLTFSLVLGTAQFSGVKAEETDNPNLARAATATASGFETGTSFTAAKVNDGNKTHASRWATNQAGADWENEWVQLAWDTAQTIKSISITWDRRTTTNYTIQVSNDGQAWTDISGYPREDFPAALTEEVTLSETITGKYLRIFITELNGKDPDGIESGVWKNVAICEIEVYGKDLPSSSNTINKGDTSISMPETAEGETVRFCADYGQVIGEDGTIYAPLENKTVKGFFETTKADGTKEKTEEVTYVVPGIYDPDANVNEKPAVIPELQEWHGKTGTFLTSASGEIIVGTPSLMEVAEMFREDYEDITGIRVSEIKTGTKEDAGFGDFYFELSTEKKGYGKEGYSMDIDQSVSVEAEEATGAYWATRSILQILKQTRGSIPKGFARDYPKFEVRAFSLDVGRKPITLEAVEEFAKNMAWYKMNSFQLHLSDNLIFHEDYPTLEEAIEHSYAGFRLESGVLNEETNKSATSEDVYYTKDEFRTFIKDCRAMGVDIVPEFDMPAHALPFTRAFPQFMTAKAGGSHGYLIEEIDLSKPGVTEWAQSIWNDYMEGDDPVFDEEMTLHIGTDEFHGVAGQEGKEMFRKFSDDMIGFVQDKGRTVRMWGSLTNKGGTTPVRSENVQLNIWNTGYANPQTMYDMGFDLINTLEGPNYIVPAAGYYNDYINAQSIYNTWKPNEIGNLSASAGDDQILGGCYAIWHDSVDTRGNGISQYDSFDRFFQPLPAYGARLWGDAADRNYADFTKVFAETGTAPGTTIYGDVDYRTSVIANYSFDETLTKDSSANGFELSAPNNADSVNADQGKALKLKGGESYVETPEELDLIGNSAVLTMRVKMDEDADGEQILCESKSEFGVYGTYAFKASQKNTGKVGFSREGYDYSFDYTLPKGEWHVLEFRSGKDSVSLYVDGELIDSNPEIYFANHPTTELSEKLRATGITKICTMMVPFGRIGSKTNSFAGEIDSVTVTGKKEIAGDYGEKLSREGWTAEACSTSPKEGSKEAVFDGDDTTYWHQDYDDDEEIDEEHHWFEIILPEAEEIGKLSYLPRQNSTNGRITEYSIIVTKEDGLEETVVSHGAWAANNNLKTAMFEPILAKKVKLKVHQAGGNHATIAELNLYKPESEEKFESDLNNSLKDCENYNKNDYTYTSWKEFENAKHEAEQILNYSGSTSQDYIYAYETLQKAIENLTSLNGVLDEAEKMRYNLSTEIKDAEDLLADSRDDFAEDSVAEFEAILKNAKDVAENNQATAADLEGAISALQNFKFVTKISAAKKELSDEITAAEALLKNTAGYTKDSVEALQKAVADAKAVLSKENATLEELTNALAELKGKQLVKDMGSSQPPSDQTPAPGPAPAPAPDNGKKELKNGSEFTVKGIKYKVVNAKALTVKLVKGKDLAKVTIDTVTAPEDGRKYKIVEISNNAFKGFKKKLKAVTIGANVATIGKNAFNGCKKLATVTIKNKSKLKKVGAGAFKGASKKIKVKLPSNLKKNKSVKNQLKKAGIKRGL